MASSSSSSSSKSMEATEREEELVEFHNESSKIFSCFTRNPAIKRALTSSNSESTTEFENLSSAIDWSLETI